MTTIKRPEDDKDRTIWVLREDYDREVAEKHAWEDTANFYKQLTMTTTRVKMRVTRVIKYNDPVDSVSLMFAAVGKNDGYTPYAAMQITTQNPALLDKFEEGQKFYVDFHPAD